MAAALVRTSLGAPSFSFQKPAVLCRAIHSSVWWDLNTCEVPKGCKVASIASNITDALAKLNNSAPVTFCAYGDTDRPSFPEGESLEALSEKGIQVFDEYCRRENICSKWILHGVCMWAKAHPAPANCLIISGDEDLSFALHQLRMRRYNILLAKPRTPKALGKLEAAANIVWQWKSLAVGGPPEWTSQ